jgi:mRNA interferase ChpB
MADLNPIRGHEQAGRRPVFIVSPADATLTIILPISQGITLARNTGFAVSLMGSGTQTQGVVICNQPRTISLKDRGGQMLEFAPEFIIDEVLARLAPLVT